MIRAIYILVAACLRTASPTRPITTEPAQLASTSWHLVHFRPSDHAIGTVTPPRVERYTWRSAGPHAGDGTGLQSCKRPLGARRQGS